MTQATETALITALVAVAKSMGADAATVRRIRDAVPEPSATAIVRKAKDEVFLNTRQVCERLGLCKRKVLSIADEIGVIRHTSRLLRYPLSRVLAWESGQKLADGTGDKGDDPQEA